MTEEKNAETLEEQIDDAEEMMAESDSLEEEEALEAAVEDLDVEEDDQDFEDDSEELDDEDLEEELHAGEEDLEHDELDAEDDLTGEDDDLEEELHAGEDLSEEALDEESSDEAEDRPARPSQVYRPLSLISKIEAIIFAAPKCMKVVDILETLDDEDITEEQVKEQVAILMETYSVREGGFRLESVRGHGYQFRTVPEAAPYMEKMFSSRPRPLSRAALETLSIVAYRQPVSRADIEFIRGVDSGSIVKNLLERSLIKCTGRKEDVAGRPMVFGTTDEFLAVFRLESLKELPPISSFQPPQDMLQSAEEQIDEGAFDDEIEEGDFVGVEGEDNPDVSEGLVDEVSDDELTLEGAVDASPEDSVTEDLEGESQDEGLALEGDAEDAEDARPIEGATLATDMLDDEESAHTEEEAADVDDEEEIGEAIEATAQEEEWDKTE